MEEQRVAAQWYALSHPSADERKGSRSVATGFEGVEKASPMSTVYGPKSKRGVMLFSQDALNKLYCGRHDLRGEGGEGGFKGGVFVLNIRVLSCCCFFSVVWFRRSNFGLAGA